MKIGIDARFLTHPQPGGFKTYSENLIAALAKLDNENEYILYVDRPPTHGCKIPASANFVSRVVPGLLPVMGMPWREQVGLASQAAKDRIDLFHSPCLTAPLRLACPLVLTIHDMIWAFPGEFPQNGARSLQRKLMEWYYRLVPRYASKRAAAIITVSHAAKESIIEHLGLDAEHIFVTYEAANQCFRQVKDEQRLEAVRRKYGLPLDFILAIGSADPRKNINALIQAYSLLPQELQEKHQLVIVWTHSLLADELSRKIEALGLEKCIRFLQQIPTDDLVLLYNAASLFVFPSLYEGFGLPLVEAMACGTPVVAANNSSIPEIVGDAALLVGDNDLRVMSTAITHVLEDKSARERLLHYGRIRANEFSWEKCAGETLEVYKQTVS